MQETYKLNGVHKPYRWYSKGMTYCYVMDGRKSNLCEYCMNNEVGGLHSATVKIKVSACRSKPFPQRSIVICAICLTYSYRD